MKIFLPKMYQKDIYSINYRKLSKKGIKCLLFDVDNTCVGFHEKKPTKKLEQLFNKLHDMEFRVILFSNARSKRLEPFTHLPVICNHSSKKPFPFNFRKILTKYGYKPSEVCIIGDQLFTDILGGNNLGIYTCLVDPLTKEDLIFTKILRGLEQLSFYYFKKKNLLKRGKYYD